MKKLLLIRHAKSSWKQAETADFDRPLNKRGLQDAPMMGKRLAANRAAPDLLLSSPANRAISTAIKLAEALQYSEAKIQIEPKIYEASTKDLLQIIQNLPDTVQDVILVGHNPAISMLSSRLNGGITHDMPTCGVAQLELPITHWAEAGEQGGRMLYFDYPKNTN